MSLTSPNNFTESEDLSEIGLPRASLNNFVKSVLAKFKMKGDKNIYNMIDKIAVFYVKHISALGCQICMDSGKKTLNIEHMLEALRRLNFDSHIELIQQEKGREEKSNSEEDSKDAERQPKNDKEVKRFLNKKKRKSKFAEKMNSMEPLDFEEAKRIQKELFEKAKIRMESKNFIMMQNAGDVKQNITEGINTHPKEPNNQNKDKENNNKEPDNLDFDLFDKKPNDEINFDI